MPTEDEIFRIAFALPTAEARLEYLNQVCRDAVERERIVALLKEGSSDMSFLEKPPVDLTVDLPDAVSMVGESVGSYKLLQPIGEGGFGIVYMAEQTKPVRRKVALKVIKPGMDTKQVVARFEAERQALAMMDHPNIAKVLDGGETENGRPYFVMELVKGVPLTEFCDTNRLSTRDRLELFLAICHAVQHAHQKGVIHRDLKPSNVMVTLNDNRPVPKIIDFGVSKAVSLQLTEKTLFTAYGQMVGTPVYMSPEQAQMSGLDIDTRADIYSLGVLLYELLTGTTPLEASRLRGTAYAEMQRMIMEDESDKPSTRLSKLGDQLAIVADQRNTDARKLGQFLRGDLDWVVMKAIEKERNRRYETASAFASDVERFLNDEPVDACPPSFSYKLQKFVRRNRGPVVAGVLVAATLLLGIAGTTVGMLQAWHDADENKKLTVLAKQSQESYQKTAASEKAAKDQLREQNYFQLITLAQVAIEDGRSAAALRLLENCPSDLRQWEWRFLKRLACADRVRPRYIQFDDVVESCVWSPIKDDVAYVSTVDGSFYSLYFGPSSPEPALITKVARTELGRQIRELQIDPSGTHLAVPAGREGFKLIDVETGQVSRVLQTQEGLAAIAFHPVRPSGIATADYQRKIQIREFNQKLPTSELLNKNREISVLRFSPNGRWLIAGGEKGGGLGYVKLNAWSNDTPPLHWQSQEGPPTNSLAFSHNNKWLVEGSKGQLVRLYDLETGKVLQRFKGHYDGVLSVAFSPNDKRVISSDAHGTVRLWEVSTRKVTPHRSEILVIKMEDSDLHGLSFSRDGHRALVAGSSNRLAVLDGTPEAATPDPLYSSTQKPRPSGRAGRVFDVAMMADGKHVISSGEFGFRLWNLRTGSETRFSTIGPLNMAAIFDCALHPNGRDVAAGPLGARHLVTWDVFDTDVDGLPKFSNPEHFGKHVSFSPDGRWLACGSAPVSVWDLHVPATDRTAKLIDANTHELKVEFSPCGRYLAAATAPLSNASKTDVVIFDASKLDENETKEISLRRLELEMRVTGFAFHPNGDSLAFVDRVGSITVIPTIAIGKEAHTSWMASKHPLTDVAYTPNGKFIATSGRDETIRIWEVATQQLVHSIVDEGFVYCVEFGQNGKTLVAGNDLGSVNVWDTSFLDSHDHRIEDTP